MVATTKYFLINASRDHVLNAVKAGIAQAGHGRKDYVSRLSRGDRIIFYSSKDKYDDGKPLQRFTAMGQVIDDEPYQPSNTDSFRPWRRNVLFDDVWETDIRPLLEQLSFIKDKAKWGFYLLGGFREIPKADFELIENSMKTPIPKPGM